jgi:carbonic anhydrase
MQLPPARNDLESYLTKKVIPRLKGGSGIEVLLLTCIDARYPHRIIETMDNLGLRGKYDQMILAGAGLGIIHKEEWRITFLDQLRFSIEKHGADAVLILEHRDCGAYREFLGVTADDPAREKAAHIENSRKAMDAILREFPQLHGNIHSLLLPVEDLDDLASA